MRRLALIALVVAGVGAGGSLLLGGSAQGSSSSTFDVIFDDARGLIGGQLVKIAGANAGQIQGVSLTSDFKARIEATIDTKFMPFYTNATCTIRPQGLIAENYVECDPGSASGGARPLQGTDGHPPTVPVSHTTEPVNLLDLFNMFNVPTRQRFMMIVDELGIGTSGRGADFNDILRRANPALALARQVVGILNAQRTQLATLVDSTDTVAAQAAGHTADVKSFLDRAAAVSTLTAAHSSNLALAVNRLPGLLAAAQPALAQLDTVAVDGTPLVRQLGASAPALNKVATDLGPFVAAAKPSLRKLGAALTKAVPAIRSATPLLKTVKTYTKLSLPSTIMTEKLFSNLQRHGFFESFLTVVYDLSEVFARYDSLSHLGVAYPLNGLGGCAQYATTPVPGCSANYNQGGSTFTPSSRRADATGPAPASRSAAPPSSGASAPSAAAGSAGSAVGAANPPASTSLSAVVTGTTRLLSKTLSSLTGSLGGPLPGAGAPSRGDQSLQGLVRYLLK